MADCPIRSGELEGHLLKVLAGASISVQAKQFPPLPLFRPDGFEDGRFNHVAMDRLQFGRH
jgi:hypothetical protein